MTSAEQVMERIEVAGGVLTVRGGRIRCRLPEEAAHLLDELREHKSEVIACLNKRGIPRMPEGVQLLRWEPKPSPVMLSRVSVSVVEDVPKFIRDTLTELGQLLEQSAEPCKLRDLVDALEQCGCIVEVPGIGSGGGRR